MKLSSFSLLESLIALSLLSIMLVLVMTSFLYVEFIFHNRVDLERVLKVKSSGDRAEVEIKRIGDFVVLGIVVDSEIVEERLAYED